LCYAFSRAQQREFASRLQFLSLARVELFAKHRTGPVKNFFAKLNRRNVYKVAIAYAVVAWLWNSALDKLEKFTSK
jgi:hypothetical protein